MGKKSLIKSTSKKKRAPKKAAASKNPKKKPAAKTAAAKAKPAAKTEKKAVPKKAAEMSKPTSVKDLLKKQFDVAVPKTLYTVPTDKAEKSVFSAPEFLAGYSADDTKRIKGLLANTYSEKDLIDAAKNAPAKKAAPKPKPVSVKELINKQFDIVVPKTLYTVPADKVEKSVFSAPELLAGYSADDTKRIKGLLANTYSEKDLKAAAEKAAAEKAAAEKAAAEKAAAEKAAAEKAAAEKAAAEKAAAEKAAAEKAAAEKAAAEKAAAEKAAAEKAAAEKAAAEKAAAEKAAAEKAAAEKAAAEKAAAEKAAAEKAAAEKAAAEKAAAEKAAAEKAAAEKAAAEKAAAEKAAAEKAAAEKAAAEKAAAEKAAAEKAAAEKAAAEKAEAIKKAAEQKPDVKVSYEPAPLQASAKKPSDPVENTIKLAAAGLAFLILLVIGASASNSSKYYLTDNQGTLEIWQGKFAPLGKEKLMDLPGIPVPEAIKDVYRSNEVYPLAFQFYINEADALLDVSGIPDFENIKQTLKTALEYGSTRELKEIAYARLDNIDRLILTYKADVAGSRGTIDDLKAAIGFLEEVSNLTPDEAQKERIAQKIADHEVLIQQLEEKAAAEKAAAEKAAAEKAAAEKAAAEKAAAEAAAAEEAAAEDTESESDENQTETGDSEQEDAAVEEASEPEAETETEHG
ncbi:hypothetical protein Dvar_42710 [Desulfosarcina variabilis str. Montpellier]|uniref:histone H1-like repetitive region-containing protein n=1 Tax=Desulfosarcina variabilis TaxID=2300 RepID=UPI003AFB75C2